LDNLTGRESIKPRASGLFCTKDVLVFVTGSLIVASLGVLEGCGASSPRFASKSKKETSAASSPRKGERFSSKEVEEEKKENDKPVPAHELESVKAGTRDFRTEKNAAIKPMDNSRMMREISKYMGVAYVYGGADENGMDCSGYTLTVYKNSVGKLLPRTASEQSKLGSAVELSGLKFGDLIFFNTTGESASHVGIYLGDDLFAHASVSQGVTISSLQSSYFKSRYESARRIVQ
jgi:cell wall-associated NlpC family hydrolase